ncbi:hypothetical protein ROHU_025603 [Labeo rohita]|uniref:Uncharacterized protein n=1 Tax=Labeo rohita TaxID=84645 RepID=A0A498MHX4_LABRO|nr:hypothetical protein ROHU_025603 [Labeo rohita]
MPGWKKNIPACLQADQEGELPFSSDVICGSSKYKHVSIHKDNMACGFSQVLRIILQAVHNSRNDEYARLRIVLHTVCVAPVDNLSSFAQESRQYRGYKCPSAPPRHCTNITLIESFTPKPTVACEMLSQASTDDLAEGIKAGKDEM